MKNTNIGEGFAVATLCIGMMMLMLLMLATSFKPKPAPVEHQQYLTQGHYYDGYVIRDDGHIWDYQSYLVEPDSPVYIKFDDNGTPEEVTDDYIICVAFDYTKTA